MSFLSFPLEIYCLISGLQTLLGGNMNSKDRKTFTGTSAING